jgi:hypothetical protein
VSRDPELQALVDKAERERARAKRPSPPPETPKQERPKTTVPFSVYMEIDRHRQVGFLWWMLPIFIVLGPVFVHERVVTYIAIGLAGALAGRIAWRFIALRRSYHKFLQFPNGLGFPIAGWPAVVAKLDKNPEEWSLECTVIVRRAPDADEAVIAAAEDLFCRAANSWYYTADGAIVGAASDPRKKWTRDGERLIGSSNNWVIGEFYRFARQLELIQRKAGGVAGVEIKPGRGSYSISRPRYSGD